MAETLEAVHTQEVASVRVDPEFIFGGAGGILQSKDPVLRTTIGRLNSYRDIARDGKVEACLQKRYSMTSNADLMVMPGAQRGSTRRSDRRIRDMVANQIRNIGVSVQNNSRVATVNFQSDFDAAVLGLLDAIMLGYAVGEIIWDMDGREVVAREIKIKAQERFVYDSEHRFRMITNASRLEGVPLPNRKFLNYTWGSFTDPYGLGLGNRLWDLVRFKRLDISYFLRFLDTYSMPTSVTKYEGGGESNKAKALEASEAVHSQGALAIPKSMDIELLQAITTAAQQGYAQLANYLDGQISQAILGVTLTTEVKGEGSRAAAQTHQVEQRVVGLCDATLLMRFLTDTLSQWIVDFNTDGGVATPRLVKLFPDLVGLRDQSIIDVALNGMGFRRNLVSVNEIYGNGREDAYEAVPVTTPSSQNLSGDTNGIEDQDDNQEDEEE